MKVSNTVVCAAAGGAARQQDASSPRDTRRPKASEKGGGDSASAAGLREIVRTVAWITGVAFGVAAPPALAQGASSPVHKNAALHQRDTAPAKQASLDGTAANSVIASASSNTGEGASAGTHDTLKANSIRQRKAIARMASKDTAEAAQYARDSEITARVKTALLDAEGLRSLDVSVRTYKGRVQLAGFVDTKAQIAQAGRIAARQRGVKKVLNSLALK